MNSDIHISPDGVAISRITADDYASFDEHQQTIVRTTSNTWQQDRGATETSRNTKQGKMAELKVEQLFSEYSDQFRFCRYDDIRNDGYRHGAPFDEIVTPRDMDEDILRGCVTRILDDIEQHGWLREDTHRLCIENRVYLVDVKSTKLKPWVLREAVDQCGADDNPVMIRDQVARMLLNDMSIWKYPSFYNDRAKIADDDVAVDYDYYARCVLGQKPWMDEGKGFEHFKDDILPVMECLRSCDMYIQTFIEYDGEMMTHAYIMGYALAHDIALGKDIVRFKSDKSKDALYMALPLSQCRRIVDLPDDDRLWTDPDDCAGNIEKRKENAMKIDYEHELNERQLEAVKTTEGPLLILAGAGSGKTRTLIYRVSYLIESGVDPYQILLLTFTNKAADEMKARAGKMLDERCGEITACTYHSFCNMMLRQYGQAIGIDPQYSILSPSDGTEIISRLKVDLKCPKSKDFPSARTIQSIISAHINTGRPLDECLSDKCRTSASVFLPDVERIASAFSDYKDEHGLLDYDDMLTKFLDLLTKRPDIARAISDTYRYIMVDEYQDTNHVQEQIIMKLREGNKNLAVVGDDYQSIYKFRGSDVGNIINFPDRMPGCKTVLLNVNYRSSEELVGFSNALMEKNNAEGMEKIMEATYRDDEKARYVDLGDQDDEVNFIINEIEREHASGMPYHDIAVLFRASAQTARLEVELDQCGIPFEKYGGQKFLDRECVQDMVCLLRCVVNPRDEIAWYRILKLNPLIGKVRAGELSKQTADQGLNALINNQYGTYKFMGDLIVMHDRVQEMGILDYEDLLTEASDYYISMRRKQIENMNTSDDKKKDLFDSLEEDKEDIETLKGLAEQYPSVTDFLDAIVLASDAVVQTSDEDRLVLSTIHSAKGLEFDTVFLMDCLDGICPPVQKDEYRSPKDQEELRCFYVAVTRAKRHLFLLIPEYASQYGRNFTQASHYLNDDVLAETDCFADYYTT